MFEDGDVFKLLERVGDEWMRGSHRGRVGIFPVSFVEVLEDLPPPTPLGGAPPLGGASATSWPTWDEDPTPLPVAVDRRNSLVRAVYDFDGKEDAGELSFKVRF